MRKATINDVAKLAGVSIKTVSRVINKEANVSTSTRERVLEAAKSLKYQPSQSARGLAGNKSYMLGILYDHLSPGYLMNVQQGILKTCKEFHYGLILNPVDHKADDLEEILEAWFRHSRIDGLILTPPFGSDQRVIDALVRNNVAAIAISELPLNELPYVVVDEVSAARDLTRHLIENNHKKIAFIKGEDDHQSTKLRLRGFQKEMEAHDLSVDPTLVASGDFRYEGSLDAARRLLDRDDPPTAIFAANDDMAAAVISIAHRRGLKIPDDIAVVGFDNSPIASQVWPTITTIDQPVQVMASLACEQLIRDIKGPSVAYESDDTRKQKIVPYAMHVRASSTAMDHD
jgi:LacI family transcriptional regulator